MKLTINTIKLQDMVTKASKGVGNNKLIPITCMMGLNRSEAGGFEIVTTDATNYLYIDDDSLKGEKFSVTVYADTFVKLISKITSENVSMEIKDNYLEVVGNGTYKIELPFDENGNIIEFPNPIENAKVDQNFSHIKLSNIQTILNSVKPALAVTLENPEYTNYWLGDSVIATDSYKIAKYDLKVVDKPILISAEMMNLLSVMTAEDILFHFIGDGIAFVTADCIVYGKLPTGITEYKSDDIKSLTDSEYPYCCEVNKTALLQLLDRIALFIRPFDDGNLTIAFHPTTLDITSLANSGTESIPYIAIHSEITEPFASSINIELLQSQVKSNISDSVKIEFGRPDSIKIVDGTITKVIALNE